MKLPLPRSLRRRIKRVEARIRGERAVVVYGQGYQHELPGVPMDGLRGEQVLTALVREGLVGSEAVVRPSKAALAQLARVHDGDYLARLSSPEVVEATFGVSVPEEFAERIVELQRVHVGGTLLAARSAWRRHMLAVNLGGGLHHAHRDRGEGFCLLNDVAVAIAELRSRGFDEAIAVVDLDLHDGDGTRSLFADDPTVWTFSIHNQHWGPTQARSSTALALGDAVDDNHYLAALRTHLPPVLDEHRPALVFYLGGCDPAEDDPLGNWRISDAGMLARDRFVVDSLRSRGIESVVWLLAGGYGSDAWRHSARGLIAALGGPEEPELPSTDSITIGRYRDLAEVIDPAELSGVAPGELAFEESDLYGAAGGSQLRPSPKVLGYYTPRGIEFALERYGILPRLRKLGFEPRIEVSEDRDSGDTVRIYGDASNELLVIEIRLSRDRKTVAGLELLRVEWLLLQNPRATWAAGRLPLPGQRHPGLRMFDDVSALMMVICDRLHLDGIVVVPSHFHVAVRWHGRMRFADPVAEGRFRALSAALEDLPLDEASTAVERRRVVDPDEPARRAYEPAALVLPVSERLRRRFGPEWEQAADAAEAAAHFEVRSPDAA